jgi:hypothetical protein
METEIDQEAEEAARQQRTLEAMKAGGASIEEHTQVDYFGFEENHQVMLPDGVSFVIHQTLNEGARRQYMNRVNREVRLQKGGDAFMKMASGDERHELLKQAIVGWNLSTRNKNGELIPVSFTKAKLDEFLQSARPSIVDIIEKDVRAVNTWLTAEITIEDIDEQIAELTELRATKVEEAEGKES